jgi:hypothetical protein
MPVDPRQAHASSKGNQVKVLRIELYLLLAKIGIWCFATGDRVYPENERTADIAKFKLL